MSLEVFYGVMIFIFGTVLGSFFNVVGYRLPNNESIMFPSSHCPNCNHKLRFYELIPVISYIFLRGKCKKCKKRISIVYPFFELLAGSLFLLTYLSFGLNFDFIIAITLISILIIISISDVRYYIIPDEILITGSILIIIELLIKTILFKNTLSSGVIMPLLNGAGAFAIMYLFKVGGDSLFNKESLGGGDIKLMFLIGLVLGFDMAIVDLFIAAFIALPLSIFSLVKNDSNILPFGPYLSIAAIIILLSHLNLDMIMNFFVN